MGAPDAYFQSMADNSPSMLWVTDATGSCQYLSQQWYAFTGRRPDQDLGFGWLENVHPGDRARSDAIFRQANADHTPFSLDYRLRRHDGEFRWMVDEARPRFTEDGTFAGFVGSVTDVHERAMAEVRLRERTQQLNMALNATGVGMWLNRLPLGDLDWDARTRELFFLPPGEEPTIEWFWARLHPDDREPTRVAVEAALRDGGVYAIDHRVVDPNTGAIRWVRSAGQATYDADGAPFRFDGTNYDITEAKQLEDELRTVAAQLADANRRKDEFLATLAHELRNPLAPLRHGVEVLRLAETHGTAIADTRAMMERQVTQLGRLVDDLLDVARISRGQVRLQRARFRLTDALSDAVETTRPLIDERGQELIVAVPDPAVYVDGDRVRLAQVVSNLLHNAAKYTDRGGRIRLALSVDGSTAHIRVEDTGIGIPPAMLERVFDMFAQVDPGQMRTQGGLGIGLNIVRQLVTMHGGQTRVESEGAGKGSQFIVQLPVVAAAPAAPAAVTPLQEDATPRRVLVADDNVDGAQVLAMLLSLMGHETMVAYDGAEAFAVAERVRPDVIFMDLGMPILSGLEACQQIRSQPWGRQIYMVAQTGWGQESDKRRAIDSGFDLHVTKPVDPATLAAVFEHAFPRG